MSNGIIPTNLSIAPPAKNAGQVVQIVSLPEALQNNARAVRLEGEVVAQNKDGSIRLQTAEGMVDISMRGKQLQPSTKLEIEIPAGTPPRNATIKPPAPTQPPIPQAPVPESDVVLTPRPAPAPLPAQTPVTKPPTSSASQGQTSAPASPQPTLPTSYQPQGKPQTQAPAVPPPLQTGQPVKVAPIPPAQAQALAMEYMASINTDTQISVTTSVARTAFRAETIVQATLDKTLPSSLVSKPADAILSPSQKIETALIPKSPVAITAKDTATPKDVSFWRSLFAPSVQTASPTKTLFSLTTPTAISKPDAVLKEFITTLGASPKTMPVMANIADVKNILMKAQIISLPTAPNPSAQSPTGMAPVTTPQSISIAAPLSSPVSMTAVVTGFTPQNFPIVTITYPSGAFSPPLVLQTPTPQLTVGSTISLIPQVSPQNIQTTAGPQAVVQPSTSTLSPLSSWPVMDDILQTFFQVSMTSAQNMMRALPSPSTPSSMGAAAMLFVAAVRSGDITGWMGDRRTDLLTKAGKADFIRRLSQETSLPAAASDDANISSEWRSYPLPMLWQNEISKTLLHIRRETSEDSKDSPEKSGTRFVMDLSLSRMGDVQIDGMMNGKRLDVILRTQMPISLSMQDAMKRAYADALDGTDIYGELGFQGDIRGWMQVLKKEGELVSDI